MDESALPENELLVELSNFFHIFSDPTRIKILYSLLDGEKNVTEIAEIVGVSQSATSHQLSQLRTARLVRYKRVGKLVLYDLCDEHVASIIETGMTHITE